MTKPTPPWILIVEDDDKLCQLVRDIVTPYGIDHRAATTASEALPLLHPISKEDRPSALILDIMLPYGDGETRTALVEGSGDELELETGLNLLRATRQYEEAAKWEPLWTAVTTARTAPQLLADLTQELRDHGRIFSKPYDDMLLEIELCHVLKLDPKLPKVLIEAVRAGADHGP